MRDGSKAGPESGASPARVLRVRVHSDRTPMTFEPIGRDNERLWVEIGCPPIRPGTDEYPPAGRVAIDLLLRFAGAAGVSVLFLPE